MNEFDEERNQKASLEENADVNAVTEDNGPEEAEEATEEEVKKPFSDILDWTSCLVYALAAMLTLTLFVFRPITVSGDSMNDTLIDKDMVLATNFFYTPEYGDIVIVEADKLHLHGTALYGETLIKRVIAKEGDVVRIDFENGKVYRNGEELIEEYIKEPVRDRFQGWMDSNVDYVVPEHCVFVMGDNRNASNDSRNMTDVGFIDTKFIMGKAFVRYAPLKSFKWL